MARTKSAKSTHLPTAITVWALRPALHELPGTAELWPAKRAAYLVLRCYGLWTGSALCLRTRRWVPWPRHLTDLYAGFLPVHNLRLRLQALTDRCRVQVRVDSGDLDISRPQAKQPPQRYALTAAMVAEPDATATRTAAWRAGQHEAGQISLGRLRHILRPTAAASDGPSTAVTVCHHALYAAGDVPQQLFEFSQSSQVQAAPVRYDAARLLRTLAAFPAHTQIRLRADNYLAMELDSGVNLPLNWNDMVVTVTASQTGAAPRGADGLTCEGLLSRLCGIPYGALLYTNRDPIEILIRDSENRYWSSNALDVVTGNWVPISSRRFGLSDNCCIVGHVREAFQGCPPDARVTIVNGPGVLAVGDRRPSSYRAPVPHEWQSGRVISPAASWDALRAHLQRQKADTLLQTSRGYLARCCPPQAYVTPEDMAVFALHLEPGAAAHPVRGYWVGSLLRQLQQLMPKAIHLRADGHLAATLAGGCRWPVPGHQDLPVQVRPPEVTKATAPGTVGATAPVTVGAVAALATLCSAAMIDAVAAELVLLGIPAARSVIAAQLLLYVLEKAAGDAAKAAAMFAAMQLFDKDKTAPATFS